jgi:hypothetical protein
MEINMNQRIQELAIQARDYALGIMVKITDKEQALKAYSESYDSKFAELIVNECGEVAFCNFHVSGVELAELMKEHFGVE